MIELEYHKVGYPYDKYSINYENDEYEYISKRAYTEIKKLKKENELLKQSLIEGNQNLQEKLEKVKELSNMGYYATKIRYATSFFEDINNILKRNSNNEK